MTNTVKMTEKANQGTRFLKIMYALGFLINLAAFFYTYTNESYYMMFFNIIAMGLCALRFKDLVKLNS